MNWFKKLKTIIKRYDIDISQLYEEINKLREDNIRLRNRIEEAENLIIQRTTVGISVGLDGNNTVIVAGNYKGVDYVETYGLVSEDFNQLVDMLRSIERNVGRVAYIDAPPQLKAVINKTQL